MKVQEIYEAIDSSIAPFVLAESWDNPGLLVGDPGAEVIRVLVTLDATCAVIAEAARLGCQLVVSHHPIIFDPIRSVTAETAVYQAIRAGVAVICAHTNWDKVQNGVNDQLAAALGLRNSAILDGEEGFCRVGCLPSETTPQDFAKALAQALGLAPRYNPGGRAISRVGLCGGAGADMAFSPAARAQGLDAFVTADVKHHQFIQAAEQGITLYDGGHFATENLSTPPLAAALARLLPGVEVLTAKDYSGAVCAII